MDAPSPRATESRCCIYLPCYNAGRSLEATVARIPWDRLRPAIAVEILFVDNASTDDTRAVIESLRPALDARGARTHLILHQTNRGYGGSVKSAMRFSVERGFDWLVVLHSDGQYAPEELPRLLDELIGRPLSAVHFGSRLSGRPLEGGMPLYKYFANRVLTSIQNAVLGVDLTEYHSGYRLYRMSLLRTVPFERDSDGFVFDNEILFQIAHFGFSITESPIPTHYGEEKSHVPVIGTPLRILHCAAAYVLHKSGLKRIARYTPR